MLMEQGRVVAIDPDRLWVEVVRHTACGGCAAKSDCGTGLIEQWFARPILLPIDRAECPGLLDSVAIGDRIEFGLPENAILSAALVTYLPPILALVLGGWLGAVGGGYWGINSDLAAGIGVLLGLSSVLVVSRFRRYWRFLAIKIAVAKPLGVERVKICK